MWRTIEVESDRAVSRDVEVKIRQLFTPKIWAKSYGDILWLVDQIRQKRLALEFSVPKVGKVTTVANFNGFRLDLDAAIGEGSFECLVFENRYLLAISDLRFKAPVQSRYISSDILVMGIRSLAGRDDDELNYRRGMNVLIGGQVASYDNIQTLPAGNPLRVVSLHLPLDDNLSGFKPQLPCLQAELVRAQQHLEEEPCFYSHFRESKQALRTLGGIVLSEYDAQLRHDHTWLKLQELLCDYEQICADTASGEKQNVYRFTDYDMRAIEKARKIIETTFASKLLEEKIARDVGLSRTRLRVFFEDQYGESVHDFAVKVRMARAQVLLRTTNMSVEEIATAVGYKHASGFRRAFKKVVGVTPRELRKMRHRHDERAWRSGA